MNKNVTVKCTEIAIAVLNLNLTTAYLKTQLAPTESLRIRLFCIFKKITNVDLNKTLS